MAEVGRDLWRKLVSASLLKQGHRELAVQDHVQTATEIQKEMRTFLVSEVAEEEMKCGCYQGCEEIMWCFGGILYVHRKIKYVKCCRIRWGGENLSLIGLTLSANLRFKRKPSKKFLWYFLSARLKKKRFKL